MPKGASDWNIYVKENYHKVAHLPNKERLKALSEMRKGAKGSEKGKKKSSRKSVKGGDVVDDVYGKVKGVTSKVKEGVDIAQKYASLADAAPDVARGLVRRGQRVYEGLKKGAEAIEDQAKEAGAEMLADILL